MTRQSASGSSTWASKPADTSTSCGANARASGDRDVRRPASRTPRRRSPGATGRLTVKPTPGPEPDVARRPGPRIQRRLVDRDEQHARTRHGRCRWSRCRGGRPSRGSAPARARARRARGRAATATLLNRQKPIARRRFGVVAGRPVDAEPARRLPARAACRPVSTAPPAACSAASNEPALTPCRRRSAPPPPRASAFDRRDVGLRVHRGQHGAVDGRRLRRARSPSQSRAELGVDRRDARRLLRVRSGVVLAARTGAQAARGSGHRRVPYLPVPGLQTQVAVIGAGAAGLYTALCAARLGARVTLDLGDAAGRVVELLGPGRPGGGARPRRQPRPPPRRHGQPRAAAPCASRPPACSATRRRARSRTSRALGVQFDADRHGRLRARARGRPRRDGAWCTPAAPRPAGGSSASCRRWWPRTSGSRCSRAGA